MGTDKPLPIDNAGNLQLHSPEPGATPPAKRRTRRTKESAAGMPDVDIPADLLSNPDKMNYVLLLAILSKMDGRVEFTSAQLDVDDSAYSIVFAKSLDGKKVVVSVVSAQSGILKTPTGDQGTIPAGTQGGYRPPPTLAEMEEFWATHPQRSVAEGQGESLPSREEMLKAARAEPTAQDKFLQQGAAAQAETQESPADDRVPNPFPFEVGDRPATARTVDLGAYAATQLHRSEQVAQEELSAAERVEREGH